MERPPTRPAGTDLSLARRCVKAAPDAAVALVGLVAVEQLVGYGGDWPSHGLGASQPDEFEVAVGWRSLSAGPGGRSVLAVTLGKLPAVTAAEVAELEALIAHIQHNNPDRTSGTRDEGLRLDTVYAELGVELVDQEPAVRMYETPVGLPIAVNRSFKLNRLAGGERPSAGVGAGGPTAAHAQQPA